MQTNIHIQLKNINHVKITNQITNKTANGAPTATNGLIVTGVCTATSFVRSGLTNIDAATLKFGGATKAQAVSGGVNGTGCKCKEFAGVLTYEDVTNVDSIGLVHLSNSSCKNRTATAYHGETFINWYRCWR